MNLAAIYLIKMIFYSVNEYRNILIKKIAEKENRSVSNKINDIIINYIEKYEWEYGNIEIEKEDNIYDKNLVFIQLFFRFRKEQKK